MPVLRNVDVFVKARADIRTQSASGGLVTLLAASTAFLLFVCQVCVYVFPNATHTLHLSESTHFPMLPSGSGKTNGLSASERRAIDREGRIPLYFKITFLHLPCKHVDVALNGEPIRGDAHSEWSSSGGSSSKSQGKNHNKPIDRSKLTIKKYPPRSSEIKTIFGSEQSHGARAHRGKGCTLVGNLRVPLVAGSLTISMTRDSWAEAIQYFMVRSSLPEAEAARQDELHKNDSNTTHFIHEVRFGSKHGSGGLVEHGYVPPLENKLHSIENDLNGVALQEVHVKLIPTVHSNPGLLDKVFGGRRGRMYQMSVVDHTLKPETMVAGGVSTLLPGISLGYDVMPLAVHIDELNGEGGFFGFLATLVGIVGGCFVTVGLFAGCAVRSVQAVAKKID